MYEIEITTPKGIIRFNLKKLEELVIPKDYIQVKAKYIPETNKNGANSKIKQKVV